MLKAYNEQGNYAVKQSFANTFGFLVSSSVQRLLIVTLYFMAVVVITLNFLIFYYWLQFTTPTATMRSFYELNSYPVFPTT